MINYAKRQPVDESGLPMFAYPQAYLALDEDASENNTVSSVITLTDSTTVIEVSAIGGAAAIKWIAIGNTNPSVVTAAATADFDHTIPSGMVRRFVVPQETAGINSIVGANKKNGLYNRVAIKSVGVASVYTTQY